MTRHHVAAAAALLAVAVAAARADAAAPVDTAAAVREGIEYDRDRDPFHTVDMRLERAELEDAALLNFDYWEAVFAGDMSGFHEQLDENAVLCVSIMPVCTRGRNAIIDRIKHLREKLKIGSATLRRRPAAQPSACMFGVNSVLCPFEMAIECRNGDTAPLHGERRVEFDPDTRLVVRIDAFYDRYAFQNSVVARCAGKGRESDPEAAQGAVPAELLHGALERDLEAYANFFQGVAPMVAAPGEDFSHLDEGVEYCHIDGCVTGRKAAVGLLRLYRRHMDTLRVQPISVYLGARTIAMRYMSYAHCRNGHKNFVSGVIAMDVDPFTGKVTRHLTVMDTDEMDAWYKRCAGIADA